MNYESSYRSAPDLLGSVWLNSEPIIFNKIENKVILLHFFDSSSLWNLETVKYPKTWKQAYGHCGLLVIGVHEPSYNFGKDAAIVQQSLHRMNIDYPVVLDNSGNIALAYNVQMSPTMCLIDKEMRIRAFLYGSEDCVEFERTLRQLLSEAGYGNEIPDTITSVHFDLQEKSRRFKRSRDISLGYLRGTIGNPEGFVPESAMEYTDSKLYISERCYLSGQWVIERDGIRCLNSAEQPGYLTVSYEAKDVYALIGVEGAEVSEVIIKQDGNPLNPDIYGSDVIKTSDDFSGVQVTVPRLYHLISNSQHGEHQLTMVPSSSRVIFYSISFTSSFIPTDAQLELNSRTHL